MNEFSDMVKAFGTVGKSKASKKKRTHSIFTPLPVTHEDDFHTPGEYYQVDKVFQNGDSYIGQWSDGCPCGNGKYLWSDGCMYAGGWEKGKTNGKGIFSWQSGATYEGQFKNGYMNGEGTYIGSNHEIYNGAWLFDMKHGKGIMNYSNGDHYEGEWARDSPDGQGSYRWNNGNKYTGKWRNGKMNGTGNMMWANGNRYDGCWMDGLPKGNGTFRWAEGSFYVGEWSKNQEERNGTYYPSCSDIEQFEWDPQEVYNVDLKDCILALVEPIKIYPSEKATNARSRRASMDEVFTGTVGPTFNSESDIASDSSGEGPIRPIGDEQSEGHNLSIPKEFRRPHNTEPPPRKRHGVTILKGDKNYELSCMLQLGIRHSIERSASDIVVDYLRATTFDTQEKLWTKFPPEGSDHTPSHQLSEFKCKDYCPSLFSTLRKLLKVDPDEYTKSICASGALREFTSPGKNGSLFYMTNDDKYVIKTMKKTEIKVILRMVNTYYNHVRAYEHTLISKFYGLHCVKFTSSQKKVRFVVMGNIFRTDVIHRCFDLKGSSHGRLAVKPKSKTNPTTTLKDRDLNFIFGLRTNLFQEFCRQLDRDIDFLEQEGIMGYSFLLGMFFRQFSQSSGEPISCDAHDAEERFPNSNGGLDNGRATNQGSDIKLGNNIPARAELTTRNDGENQLVGKGTGVYYDVILHFGIIDILQDYDINKKLEHAYKSFHYDPTSISAVDPKQYSKRFREFIFGVFTEDT